MVACLQGSDTGQKCFKISRIFKFWHPAMTDPHKVRPCNCSGISPYQIGIDPEGFSPVFISRLEIWRLMDPLQNKTFWPVNYQISTKLSPTLTEYCGWAVHAHAFIFTALLGKGRQSRHRKYKVHILGGCLSTMLRCRSKMFKNSKNIQFWRPAVSDPHTVRPRNCTAYSKSSGLRSLKIYD